MAIDEAKLEAFMGQAVTDLGAAISGLLIHLGDRLGLYKAMAGAGPLSSSELAERAGTSERLTREWLSNQAAGGYVEYDPNTAKFTLPDEQAAALADEDSPAFVCGGFEGIASAYSDYATFEAAFRGNGAVGWHEHDHRLFRGTERFFRPGYRAHLIPDWLPTLDGVVAKLEEGGSFADVGCGHGASTIALAEAYPEAQLVGFDYHDASIAAARKAAADAGVADRVTFEVASAQTFGGGPYDVVAFFDCLHDMGDPVGAARQALANLAPDGHVLLVEPNANDRLEDNLNVVGRAFYGFSTVICTPASLSQDVGLALGAQAGEARLRAVFEDAGFTKFRRATETPFNLVLEARP